MKDFPLKTRIKRDKHSLGGRERERGSDGERERWGDGATEK